MRQVHRALKPTVGRFWAVLLLLAGAMVAGAVPATAQPSWPAGQPMGSEEATTGTLNIRYGTRAGTFRVQNVPGTMSMEFYQPMAAVPIGLALQEVTPRGVVLRSQSAELRGGPIDAQTALFEYSVLGQVDPLAISSLRADTQHSTRTLRLTPTGMEINGERGETIYFTVGAPQVFRDRSNRGFRLVAPMREGMKTRLAISTRPLTAAEVTTLELPE